MLWLGTRKEPGVRMVRCVTYGLWRAGKTKYGFIICNARIDRYPINESICICLCKFAMG